jgi:hypothetical protein
MYELSLPKVSNFLGNIMDKYKFSYRFSKKWPNFNILVIIMWQFREMKFELSVEGSSILYLSLGNRL